MKRKKRRKRERKKGGGEEVSDCHFFYGSYITTLDFFLICVPSIFVFLYFSSGFIKYFCFSLLVIVFYQQYSCIFIN